MYKTYKIGLLNFLFNAVIGNHFARAEKMSLQKLSTAEIRERLADIINEAAFGNRTTIIERYGKGIAAIVPIEFVAERYKVPTDQLLSWSTSSNGFVSVAVNTPIQVEEGTDAEKEMTKLPKGGQSLDQEKTRKRSLPGVEGKITR